VRHIETAVVAEQDVVVVLRIDPDRVMVAVRDARNLTPVLSAVDALEERRPTLVGDLRVGRIDSDLAVIHPAVTLVRQELPGPAAVVRSPDAALLRIGRWGRRLSASATSATAPALPRLHECAVVIDAGTRAAAGTYFDR